MNDIQKPFTGRVIKLSSYTGLNYAGGAELLRDKPNWLVEPVEMRLDTLHNCFRPVFNPVDWADRAMDILADPPVPEECREMVVHLEWSLLWSQWKRWLLGGLA